MTVATPKTKRNLIEVARQLFAKKGVDSTTMNEIAEASGYG
ncbi:MAG TPA: TetR family transcriptional regulator, partial [Porphyromonadaceae bacterium]|nr:TetR family transcriptional regulator [Porphyromonadaceae bacterium]